MSKPNTFFTADTHFNHANIIKYAKRPFADVNEMNEILIKNWNEVVQPDDVVWHLGDFAMGDQRAIPSILARLNGNIHLIWGNHDKRDIIVQAECFASLQDVAMFKLGNEYIFLSHYGHRVWNGSHKGTYHFYGHSHSTLAPIHRSIDVGVDVFNFRPVMLPEIKKRLDSLGLLNADPAEIRARLARDNMLDHHGERHGG